MAEGLSVGLLAEGVQVIVLAGILGFLVHRSRQEGVSGEAGWNWILLGLWVFLLWSGLDLLDNVPAVASDPRWRVVDEVFVDVLPALGTLALAAGLRYRIPYPARLETLAGALEERVEERTAELAESEARFRAIAENIDAAVWLAEMGEGLHAEAEIVYLGPGYEDLFYQSREEVEEDPFETWLERVHPDDRERVRQELSETTPSDPAFEIEYRAQLPDGEVRWLRTEGFPVESEGDGPQLLAGISQDVTDIKEREQILDAQHRYLDRVLDAFPDVVYVLGPDGILRRWNDSLPEVTGYPDEEIGSMHGTDFFPEEEQPRIAEAIQETFETGWTRIRAPFLTADGEMIPDDVREDLVHVRDSGQHVVGLTETVRNLVEVIRGGGEVQVQPTALREVLDEEVRHVARSYPDASVDLAGEVPDVDVRAGPLLGSVLRNLLNNAILHNDKDEPWVEVGVERDGDAVAIRVADDGPGMPEDAAERLEGEAPLELEGDASGSMGLYLVRRLVDSYGGSIEVGGREPEGAVVTLRLDVADGA